jgi:hypothetical protein
MEKKRENDLAGDRMEHEKEVSSALKKKVDLILKSLPLSENIQKMKTENNFEAMLGQKFYTRPVIVYEKTDKVPLTPTTAKGELKIINGKKQISKSQVKVKIDEIHMRKNEFENTNIEKKGKLIKIQKKVVVKKATKDKLVNKKAKSNDMGHVKNK